MEDREIVALYLERSERALGETKRKYGRLCRAAAMRILGSREDAEEVENDAYLRAWNAIPPAEPVYLGAFMAAVCRRLAIDRLRANKRLKRGAGQYARALEELEESVSGAPDPADEAALRDAIERFLDSLPEETRDIFMKRYWWFLSVKEIAAETGLGESAVKMRLSRTRAELKRYLEGEDPNESR